jgi:hypothetical protein
MLAFVLVVLLGFTTGCMKRQVAPFGTPPSPLHVHKKKPIQESQCTQVKRHRMRLPILTFKFLVHL